MSTTSDPLVDLQNLEEAAEGLTMEQARRFFDAAGLPVPQRLRDAILQEFTTDPNYRFSFSDMASLYAVALRTTSAQLRDSIAWMVRDDVNAQEAGAAILCDAPMRVAWSIVVMFVVVAHQTIVCFRDSTTGWRRDPLPFFLTFDFLATAVYVVDLFVCANTCTNVADSKFESVAMSRRRFVRTVGCWLDIAGTVPLDILFSLIGAADPWASTVSCVVSHLRLLRIFTLPGRLTVSGKQAVTAMYVMFFYQFVPILRLVYYGVCCVNVLATLFNVIRMVEGGEPPHYVTSVYLVIQTVTTVGYGDVSISTKAERWYAVFLVMGGLLFNAIVIGRLVSMIQLGDVRSQAKDKLRETLAVLNYFSIPRLLQVEILGLQSHALHSNVMVACHKELAALPQSVRTAFVTQRHVDVLLTAPCIQAANEALFSNEAVLYALAMRMSTDCSKPEEYVSCYGEPHRGLRFLQFGFVDRLDNNGHYLLTVVRGDHLGFETIFDLKPEDYNHKALSYCEFISLSAVDFHAVMKKFPKWATCVKEALEKENLGSVPWWTGKRRNPVVAGLEKIRQANAVVPASPQLPATGALHHAPSASVSSILAAAAGTEVNEEARQLRQKLRALRFKLLSAIAAEEHHQKTR